MPVKRQFFFFAFVAIVLASYGAVRALQGETSAAKPSLSAVYFYDKSDKKVTLEDFKGKVVLVNLWATWCTPCVAELPSLDRLQKALPADKFVIVAISMDTSSMKAVGDFLKKRGIKNLDVYWDKDRQLPLKWKYDGLPTSFLLDRDGNTIARYDGPYVWDQDPVLKDIRERVPK